MGDYYHRSYGRFRKKTVGSSRKFGNKTFKLVFESNIEKEIQNMYNQLKNQGKLVRVDYTSTPQRVYSY